MKTHDTSPLAKIKIVMLPKTLSGMHVMMPETLENYLARSMAPLFWEKVMLVMDVKRPLRMLLIMSNKSMPCTILSKFLSTLCT